MHKSKYVFAILYLNLVLKIHKQDRIATEIAIVLVSLEDYFDAISLETKQKTLNCE
jgi:hypothetical protein